jgi:uncharacterized protein YbjT (DUF2867 family)
METPGGAARPTADQALRHALADLERARGAFSDARAALGGNWDPTGPALTEAQDQARRLAYVTIRACHSEIDTAAEALRRAAGGAR